MKVVDANVLLYAVNKDAAHHQSAHSWLDKALAGADTVGFSWVCMLAFLRISTHAGILPQPLTSKDASGVLELWLDQPGAVTLESTPRHLAVLSGLLTGAGTAGNLVNDAHLAALAVEHNGTIVSFDREFARFDGVRWQLPEASG